MKSLHNVSRSQDKANVARRKERERKKKIVRKDFSNYGCQFCRKKMSNKIL